MVAAIFLCQHRGRESTQQDSGKEATHEGITISVCAHRSSPLLINPYFTEHAHFHMEKQVTVICPTA